MIKIRFFAQLRERLNCEQIEIASAGIASPADVISHLIAAYPQWEQALRDAKLLVAVNQVMAKTRTPVADGDEVAFFPPVTGG